MKIKNICIVGSGSASIKFLEKLYKNSTLNLSNNKNVKVKYGFISENINDIHYIQNVGVDFFSNYEIQSTKEAYEPIINRKITRGINYLLIGKNTCRGLTCYNDSNTPIEAYNESKENIELFLDKLTAETDLVITVAAVGLAIGTYCTPLINTYIKSKGIPVVTFIQKPPEFEGIRAKERFKDNVEIFKSSSNETIIFESQAIMGDKKSIDFIEFFNECDLYMEKIIMKYLVDKKIIEDEWGLYV